MQVKEYGPLRAAEVSKAGDMREGLMIACIPGGRRRRSSNR